MKTKITFLFVVILIMASMTFCVKKHKGSNSNNVKNLEREIIIIYKTTKIPDSLKKILEKVVENYDNTNSRLQDSLIIYDTTVQKQYQLNGNNKLELAFSTHGKIWINLQALSDMTKLKFRDVITHELFHTLRPKLTSFIDELLLPLDNPVFITGFRGMSFTIKYNEATKGYWSILEEAGAEVCAVNLYHNYACRNTEYTRVALLLQTMLQLKWFTYSDLFVVQKSSDPVKIFGMILKKDKSMVSIKDLALVVTLFHDTWHYNNWQEGINAVAKERGEEGKYKEIKK